MTTVLKTRFCPSPTGFLHIGNMRTALFNALIAFGQGAKFLLRIEDTDKTRSSSEFSDALMHDLTWLGLIWDEGPGCDAGNGPYFQSERQAVYDKFYDILVARDLAYPCFCTERDLEVMRKIQRAANRPPRYDGTCRKLSKAQVAEKLKSGLPATLRFAVPENSFVVFEDIVRGEQRFNSNDLGDFIIRRTDGTPPFMYCNAIDDAAMQVSHVLRGEDHLTNTPRQILILQALGLPVPVYGHISLIIGSDGAPLSKRTGSQSISAMAAQGFLPLALINYLARLGHHYADEHLMDLKTLAANFAFKNLGAAPAKYDYSQLLRWQKLSLHHLGTDEIWNWFNAETKNLVPENQKQLFIETIKPNISFPPDATDWAKIFFTNDFSLAEEAKAVLATTHSDYFKVAIKIVEQQKSNLDPEVLFSGLKTELNLKGKLLFQPARIALTGQLHGPEMKHIFELLGAEKIIARFERFASHSKN